MNILQLSALWATEKEAFKQKELGALQNFVRKILECVELFNLQEGKESTPPHDRRNVFIQEDTDNKERNRPDFVLYLEIDQTQIKIPVEVEKHDNIQAGKKQIEKYKELYNAVYAILTDGNEWRFYDGETVRNTLKLDEILQDPDIFQTFWKEYTQPETYYVSFFEKMTSQKTLFDREGVEVEDNREMFFDDITKLIREFKYKLRLSEYFKKEKHPDKVATEISYAYVIQYILYKTLVDNDYSDKKKEFLGRFKEVHKSLKSNVFGEVLSQAGYIAEYISENLYRPFSAEQQYIEERLNEIKKQAKKSISDISAWLDIFIFIKKYNFASVRNELFGYIYENYLKELYQEQNKGQYFTDPAVVEFMLDEIGYTVSEIKKRIKAKPEKPDISIIDPACGSGTFLYSAAKRIIDAVHRDEETAKQAENLISENVFGLDIEEFPLYLAEMGILMKMLPLIVNEKYNNPMDKKIKLFKTEDSISEFVDMMHSISEQKGQGELFTGHIHEVSKFMRDEQNLAEMKDSMRPPRRRFDFVIGNPPYIGFNECCKQELEFTKLMKQKNLSMGNIYGVNLHSAPERRKTYSPKPNIYAFFIALGLSLLKKNSKMSYIIPQTILTAGDLDVLRYHLSKETTIISIITFAGKMFIGRGLKQQNPVATSSLIFVVNSTVQGSNNTKIINYNSDSLDIETTIEEIFTKNEVTAKDVPQLLLSKNVTNWNFITHEKKLLDIYECYKKKTESCSIYYHHALAEPMFKQRFYFDIGFTLNTDEIKSNKDKDLYELLDFKCFSGYSSFSPNEYYPKDTSKIKLTQNSQGYVTLEQKHKIVWRVKNPDRFCYTDRSIIFYMGKAAIICSNYKEEILYLLSLLNSFVLNMVFELNLKSKNEKEYLIPIKGIKEYFRVPLISEKNQSLKDEVIKRTKEMLDLEDVQLQDFVDFSDISRQKFDSIQVRGNHLVLEKSGQEYLASIKSKKEVVKAVIKDRYGDKELLPGEVVLSELKHLMALDKELQDTLKIYIDDLVFALYFNVPVKKIGLKEAGKIKELCRKNEFYDYIQKGVQGS